MDSNPQAGASLPSALKSAIEVLSRVSMDGVKVHYNSPKPADLGALAYAQGAVIHLKQGQERHLPHEAWHVAQQRQRRVRPQMWVAGQPVNNEAGLEHEAQEMGARARLMSATPMAVPPSVAPARSQAASEKTNAPVQGFWPFTRAQPAVDHAPPANLNNRITALQQSLATAAVHEKADPAWYKSQQDSLHAAEADVHSWLRDHGHHATEQQRQAVAGHLGTLEDHHADLVRVQLAHNHPLWLPEGTSKSAKAKARRIWNSLKNNSGNLEINSTDDTFRTNTLADFAKLLQHQHGRNLVNALNSPSGATGGPRNVRISDDWSDKFQKAGREHQAGSWATPLISGTNAHENGTGIGSYVQIDRAHRHAATGEHGDTSIPMPHYVTLGHELGHALHNLRGQHHFHTAAFAGLGTLDQSLWDDPEEHTNISSNENAIRRQHGLPERAYHKPPQTVGVERSYAGLRDRVADLSDQGIDVPDWASPYAPHRIGFDETTNTREFDPQDATTYGNASQFFGRANAHLDSAERWHRLKRGLRRGVRVVGGLAVAGAGLGATAYGIHRAVYG